MIRTALRPGFLAGFLATFALLVPALAADDAGAAKTRVTPPWDVSGNPAAEQKEAIFADYRFRDGGGAPAASHPLCDPRQAPSRRPR
jgi:hypothetical protein